MAAVFAAWNFVHVLRDNTTASLNEPAKAASSPTAPEEGGIDPVLVTDVRSGPVLEEMELQDRDLLRGREPPTRALRHERPPLEMLSYSRRPLLPFHL
jgi:hypothetical protein